MKKKLIYLVLLTILIALFLCACSDTIVPETPSEDTGGWVELPSITPAEMYTKFIGGFTAISGDFSKASLRTSPKLSVDSKLKLEVNGNNFWVTLKANYLNTAPQDVMLALEISTEEDNYDKNVLEVYIHKEKINIGLGETKISFSFPTSTWSSVFPFEKSLDNSNDVQKVALLLASTLDLEDETMVAKTRQNGTIEEFMFDFKISLPSSLKKIFEYIKLNSDKTINEMLNKFGTIISNIFGVSVDDITQGNFPKSTMALSFDTSNRKISALDLKLELDIPNDSETMLFSGENLDLTLDLIKLETSKKDNVSIDFVLNEAKQNRYVYYVNKAFNISAGVSRTENNIEKHYNLNVIAKVLQDDPQDNYAFIEYKDSNDNVIKSLYFYKNNAYYYDTIEGILSCVYKFELDLNAIASKVMNNEFYNSAGDKKSKLEGINLVSYLIGSLKINSEQVKLYISESFYSNVWYNFEDTIDYVNDLFVEDMREMEELANAYNFLTKPFSVLYFEYDKSLVTVYDDSDLSITNIIDKLETAEPLNTLTPIPILEE